MFASSDSRFDASSAFDPGVEVSGPSSAPSRANEGTDPVVQADGDPRPLPVPDFHAVLVGAFTEEEEPGYGWGV